METIRELEFTGRDESYVLIRYVHEYMNLPIQITKPQMLTSTGKHVDSDTWKYMGLGSTTSRHWRRMHLN